MQKSIMEEKKTVADYPELVAQWHPTKNGDLRPEDVSYGSAKVIWWQCLVIPDHEWQSSPNNRTCRDHGCPCCTGRKVVPSNSLPTTHPEIAAQWHKTKNGNLTPSDVVAGSNKKVWWQCSVATDHEWESSPNTRTSQRTTCPCCLGRRLVESNCLAITHPELAAQWHPTKNGDLTPYDLTAGNNKKVWWQCSVAADHEWKTSPNNRTSGITTGCPCCSNFKVVPSNCLTTTHPALAAQWHHTKNGNLTPYDVTVGSSRKVWWQCPIATDHEWEVGVNQRKRFGCPCCENLKVVLSNCLATTHPELAAQWHPTKNEALTPYDVVFGSDRRVWWKCPKDHEWKAVIQRRSGTAARVGCGCPKCNESRGEKAITAYLNQNNITFTAQWKFKKSSDIKRSRFDFAIKHEKYKGVIEYHGVQHYKPTSFGSKKKDAKIDGLKKILKRDFKKRTFCKQHGIPMLEIPFWDFDRIPKILDNLFAGLQPTFSESPEIVKKYEPIRQKILSQST